MKVRVAFLFTHRIQYFTNILDELHRRGHVEVAAFCAHETARIEDSGFGRRIEWDNRPQSCYEETFLTQSARRSHGPFLHSFSIDLFAKLKRFNPDFIHLNGYNAAIQWLGWLWSITHGIPLLVRGDGDTLGRSALAGWTPQAFLAHCFTRLAAHVFYQGEENRAFWRIRGANPERMSWIPCVSDGQVFRQPAFADDGQRIAFRASHGVGPSDVAFLVSGKLEARKRPGDAIEALACCGKDSVRLWFLGSGPLENDLKRLADARGVGHRIHWFGFRNQTESPAVLQGADVLLHPSERDPWPYSVLEGAISGLALLLSDKVGSHPDWVAAAGAGQVFPCGAIDQIAQRMNALAEQTGKRAGYAAAARQTAGRYIETEFCERFERVIESLADAPQVMLN